MPVATQHPSKRAGHVRSGDEQQSARLQHGDNVAEKRVWLLNMLDNVKRGDHIVRGVSLGPE